MRLLSHVPLCAALCAAAAAGVPRPAAAQRGAPPATHAPAIPRHDTTRVIVPPGGVMLDFQDQELKVVLDAIAAAGDLNVSFSDIPTQRVTMHLGRPLPRDSMAAVLQSVAEQHGLKVTRTASLIQIAGTPPPVVQTFGRGGGALAAELAAAQAQQQNQQIRLFTYRLKHASAVQLAPVLTNLFSGAGGPTGQAITIPNGRGGFQVITPAAQTGVTTITTPFAGGGGRGARGGGAAGGATTVTGVTVGGGGLAAAFQEIAGALSSQANEIRIVPEESSNSLLVRATENDWQLVQQLIQAVDLRPLQVLIEVTIAEVERNHDYDVGVSGVATKTRNGGTETDTTGFIPSAATARDFVAELTGGHGTVNYNVAISALQERGDVKVLSLPVIIAQNNRQAVLNVGSQRPFVQVSQTVPLDPTSRVQTVQYIDVGTVLTITPTINPDGYVNLQVDQQDNSASNEIQFDAPVINKREAQTQIFIRDGQTTVIGGLAGHTLNNDVSGIPILSRIPILGPILFGQTVHNDDTTELYLFLTPHIITSDDDIDKLRNAVQDSSALIHDINPGPHIVPKPDGARAAPDTSRRDSSAARRRPPAR